MKMLRYGIHDNSLLMEMTCPCGEYFSFVADYDKEGKLINETFLCPAKGCKEADSVYNHIPKQYHYVAPKAPSSPPATQEWNIEKSALYVKISAALVVFSLFAVLISLVLLLISLK